MQPLIRLAARLPRIGSRLTACFAVIVLLMVIGDAIAWSQFQARRIRFEHLVQEDQKQLAVLRVHTELLAARDQIDSLVTTRDAEKFVAALKFLHDEFQARAEQAKQALRASNQGEIQSRLLITIEAARSAFALQTRTMADLALAGDWTAVQLRMERQVGTLRSITAAAVKDVDQEVLKQRAQALQDIKQLERRLLLIVPVTAILTLLAAGVLGLLVTSSITRPLARLNDGARAFGRGQLDHRILVDGEDELATLAHAFNYAAEHLQESYANLKAAHDQLAAELKERIRAEREVQALSERLISVQEDERARIARELHDDLSQQIGVLSITASNLKQHLPGAAAEAHEHIERLRQKLVQLAQSVRQLSHQLHPVILEHGGLAAALRSYCAEFSSLNGISVVCYAADKFDDLSSEAALCIYRVVQEALQNVAKHAATKEATVQLTRLERHVSLVVADRGAGCSSGRISKGLGLVSMKERVRVVSGTFEFKSEPEKGTTVMVQIPLAKEE